MKIGAFDNASPVPKPGSQLKVVAELIRRGLLTEDGKTITPSGLAFVEETKRALDGAKVPGEV